MVVALGFLLNALLFALVLAGIRERDAPGRTAPGDAGLLWPIYGALIAIDVLVALLLLRRNPFGWVLAMLLVCIVARRSTWRRGGIGSPEYIRMAIFSAMALYLNQREVRAAFAWHPVDAAPQAERDRPTRAATT